MAPSDYDYQHTRDHSETSGSNSSLFDLLSNTLILHQTVPYLPISSVLNVAATSKSFCELLQKTPGVYRHLDLTRIKSAQFDIDAIDHGGEVWRNVQLDENLTEDDFYSGPLRGVLSSLRRRDVLQDVRTLILDGLSVTSEFCHEILVDPSLRIRILSLRETKNLNERKLMQSLRFACRSTRPDGMPRLTGLYVFGKRDIAVGPEQASQAQNTQTVVPSRGTNISVGWNHKSQQTLKETIGSEGEDWYSRKGRMISKHIADGWAETLLDCRESLNFDAVLCTGPRHQNSPVYGKTPVTPVNGTGNSPWGMATFALGGCASCGTAPEGFTAYGISRTEDLPLLSPVPLHASSIKAATYPSPNRAEGLQAFVPRCLECIRERYCFSCNQWWCEACYQVPSREELAAQHVQIVDQTNGLTDHEMAALEAPKVKPTTPKITRSCWECEHNCLDCIAETQKRCQACGGGYCIIHYEGSTATLCDWCSVRRGRRRRELH
ncbi:hypothetical protein F5Y18DRAFT_377731 [Xylariaceae sp. FL1019]|nr:hypothetical protein F5Y18DRAFT_377731 [Xylariaceae sp. FL1019]